MPLAPGERVDRYEVLELLGSGGMGEVYRALDPRLQRHVALKVLHVDRGAGTDGALRLLREARAVAALAHPNVLAIFDVGEVQEPEHLRGITYLAMELVPGKPLRAFVGDPSVPLPRRISWVVDIARGLAAAHHAGLVHRDVKPENVMIRDDGVVKVLDFGIARRAFAPVDPTSSTEGQVLPTLSIGQSRPGLVIGTPFYMAPEQMRGDPLDSRADQFSWGVTAYELLCGQPPWRKTGDSLTVVSAVLSHHPEPPIALEPDIPRSVSDAIMRALSKDTASRFPSTDALLEALGNAPTMTSVAPPRASAPRPAGPVVPTSVSPGVAAPSKPAPERSKRSARWAMGGIAAAAIIALGVAAASRRGADGASADRTEAGAVASPDATCATNADCAAVHPGEAWRCHSMRHACVPVASPDCKALAQPQDLSRADTLWLGALFPLDDSGFLPDSRAIDLARQEFAQTISPLSARGGKGRARPIALALCDESADPTRAARHLLDDLEVPAVVGFRRTATALEIIGNDLLPAHVLSIIAINQTDSLTRIPEPHDEPRLVWRTTLNDAGAVAPIAALVTSTLEPRAHAQGAKTIRVALVRTGSGLKEVAEELFRRLSFNGRPALENGDDFRQFVFDDRADAGEGPVVAALADFAPQVILYQGRTFAARVAAPLERRWTRGAARPTYVATSSISTDMIDFAGGDPDRRHRLFGVTNVSTTMANAQLVLRYNVAWPREPVSRASAPQPSYDAFYLLAFATYALGDAPISGPTLSGAFARLRGPGKRVDVGPDSIFEAFDTLHAGGSIDLQGALGAMDLDPATGESPIDWAILCPGLDPEAAPYGVESGLVYDAASKKLTGALRCP